MIKVIKMSRLSKCRLVTVVESRVMETEGLFFCPLDTEDVWRVQLHLPYIVVHPLVIILVKDIKTALAKLKRMNAWFNFLEASSY